MTENTAPDAMTTWTVVTRRNGTYSITAATWEHKSAGRTIEFSNGGNSCAAMFDREDVVAILEDSAVAAVSE